MLEDGLSHYQLVDGTNFTPALGDEVCGLFYA